MPEVVMPELSVYHVEEQKRYDLRRFDSESRCLNCGSIRAVTKLHTSRILLIFVLSPWVVLFPFINYAAVAFVIWIAIPLFLGICGHEWLESRKQQ
jgi:hypothetical protein